MTNKARKIRHMLHTVRRHLRSDLSELAEDVLQQRLGATGEVLPDNAEGHYLEVERLRTELALRTMASRYALLRRIDAALEPHTRPTSTRPPCPSKTTFVATY